MFANPHNDSIPIIMSVFDYRVTVFYRFQAKNDPLFPCTYAVSYTHLRAHETRHDLVCRLLLEKNKQISEPTRQAANSYAVFCFQKNKKTTIKLMMRL